MFYLQTSSANIETKITDFRSMVKSEIQDFRIGDIHLLYAKNQVSKFAFFKYQDCTIIFDGRIDNLNELSKQTKQLEVKEIIQVLIDTHGIAKFQNFIIGSFSIVNIRSDKKIDVISDFYSLQQIYYSIDGDIKISSEIELLMTERKVENFNLEKFAEYFSPVSIIDESGLQEETTYFKNIYKIPSASIVGFDYRRNVKTEQNKYWFPPKTMKANIDYPEINEEFLSIFTEVNENYINQYDRIGVELSGGIDSSCLVSLLLRNNNGTAINSFTLTGGTDTWHLEQEKIDAIKRWYPHLNTNYLDVERLYDYVEKTDLSALKSIAQPNVLNLPTALSAMFAQAKGKDCEVLLSGEGADWFLEGTDYIWDWLFKNKEYSLLCKKIYKLFGKFKTLKSIKYLYSRLLLPIMPKYLNSKHYTKNFYESISKRSFPDIFQDQFRVLLEKTISRQIEELNKEDDFQCWNQRLEHELMFPPNHNWQSLNNDNHYILPYLDKRVIEFGLQIPPDKKFMINKAIKTYYGSCKKMQREAFKGIAPPEIVDSTIKSEYSLSVSRRFEEGMENISKDKLVVLSEMGIIDLEKSLKYFEKYQNSHSIEEKYEIEAWLDGFLNIEYWSRFVLKEEGSAKIKPAFSPISKAS